MIKISDVPIDGRLTTVGTGFQMMHIFQVQSTWMARLDYEFFAKQIGGVNRGYWTLAGLIGYNASGQLVSAGTSITPVKSAGAVNWTVQAIIQGADTIVINVQGDTGMTVDWAMRGKWQIVE